MGATADLKGGLLKRSHSTRINPPGSYFRTRNTGYTPRSDSK
jgi:hypothetical protein